MRWTARSRTTSAQGGDRQPVAQQQRNRRPLGRRPQGKSSGEFVGDEAVGKGGRRTPSRLTPDPDRERPDQGSQPASRPAGPPAAARKAAGGRRARRARAAKRPGRATLGGWPAGRPTLRNKAEGIDLRFQVVELPSHRSEKDDRDHGARSSSDLKAGRYQNALRQRHVLLEWLGNVKQYLEGEVESPPGRHAESADRHSEGDPRQHAGGLAGRLGRAQSPVLRAAFRGGAERGERQASRGPRGGSHTATKGKEDDEGNCKLQIANCRLLSLLRQRSVRAVNFNFAILQFTFCNLPLSWPFSRLPAGRRHEKMVIPFDFVSKFRRRPLWGG